MRVRVVLLRRDGLRLKAAELAAPVEGCLRVDDSTASSFKRVGRLASLVETGVHGEVTRTLLHALFDPVVLRMDATTFSLGGVELRCSGERVTEVYQVWRCGVIGPGRPETRR
jgi:hypothetical protein